MLVKKEFDKLVDGKQTPTLHATFSSLSSGNGIFRRKKSFAPSYTLLDMFENSREFDPFELSEGFATVWRRGASPTLHAAPASFALEMGFSAAFNRPATPVHAAGREWKLESFLTAYGAV